MARCGCAGNVCTCTILPGTNTEVSGSGSQTDPYQVHARLAKVTVADTASVDLTLTGDGSETLPYRLSADLAVGATGSAGTQNFLINGDMGIKQRLGTNDMPDRWGIALLGGACVATRPQAGFNIDAGVNGADYYLQLVTTGQAAAGDICYLYQRVEQVRPLSGRLCVLSFLARSPDNAKILVEFQQHLGTGTPGTYSYYLPLGVTQLDNTWKQYELAFNAPSLAGKGTGALAGDESDFISINVFMSSGSSTRNAVLGIQNKTVQITDVQIEPGARATPYVRSPRPDALARCRRYLSIRKSTNTSLGSFQHLSNNGIVTGVNKARLDFALYPPMLRAPGIIQDPTVANYAIQTQDGTYAVSSMSQVLAEPDMTTIEVTTTTSTMTVGRSAILVRSGVPATYIGFSADV